MAKVTVKFLGDVADAVKTDVLEVEVPPPSTLRKLFDLLVEKFGETFRKFTEIGSTSSEAIVLVNGSQAGEPDSTVLKDGDFITFLPMVEGG